MITVNVTGLLFHKGFYVGPAKQWAGLHTVKSNRV